MARDDRPRSHRSLPSRRTMQSLTSRPFANEREWTPERRIGVFRPRSVVEIGQHGLTQRLGAAKPATGFEPTAGRSGEAGGGPRTDRTRANPEPPRPTGGT